MDRYGRQARLAEVGATGQARIARAIVDVRLDGIAADVAARYLAGAGVAAIRVRSAALAEAARLLAPALRVVIDPTLGVDEPARMVDFVNLEAAAVAQGALVAMSALRAALAESP